MKKASKILLIIFGAIGVANTVSVIGSLAVLSLVSFLYVAALSICAILIGVGVIPITDVEPEASTQISFTNTSTMVAIILLVAVIILIFSFGLAIASVVFEAVVLLLSTIFAFIGGSKKGGKKTHVFNIVCGAYIFFNISYLLGAGLIVGGVFGVIADSKEEKLLDEVKEEATEVVG